MTSARAAITLGSRKNPVTLINRSLARASASAGLPQEQCDVL